MDSIEFVRMRYGVGDRISLDELERIAALALDVHTDHLEPSFGVTSSGASLAAEQIEKARPHPFTVQYFAAMCR